MRKSVMWKLCAKIWKKVTTQLNDLHIKVMLAQIRQECQGKSRPAARWLSAADLRVRRNNSPPLPWERTRQEKARSVFRDEKAKLRPDP